MITFKTDAIQDGKTFTPYITGKFVVVHGDYVDVDAFDSYEEALEFTAKTEEKSVIIGATYSRMELMASCSEPEVGVEDHT